jgi:S1-C subfamily serine protease
VDEEAAGYLGLNNVDGVYVTRVYRRGPAGTAGLRPWDIIQEFNGRRVRSQADMEAVVSSLKIGDKVDIIVEREGQLLKGSLAIGERP